MEGFRAAVDAAVERLAPAQLRLLADRIATGAPDEDVLRHFADQGEVISPILAYGRSTPLSRETAATYLHGVAAGYGGRRPSTGSRRSGAARERHECPSAPLPR